MEMREAALRVMLGEARNILVQADERMDQATVCKRFFEGLDSPRAVIVSFEESAEDWLSDYQRSSLDPVAYVSVGETVRSTAATTPTDAMNLGGASEELLLEGVGDPADLPALGLTIRSLLEAFHESGTGNVVMCFDSLSALLEAVSLRQAFRFLHILTNLISAYGATAHYHYDDGLTDQDTETLRPLFDAEFSPHHSHDPDVWILESTSRPSADE